MFLLKHVWRVVIQQKCTSKFCPKADEIITRYPLHHSFSSISLNNDYRAQLDDMFPQPNKEVGYCAAKFKELPPGQSAYAVNDTFDVNTTKRVEFYECRGVPIVVSANFVSGRPWMVPIDIANLSPNEIICLPPVIKIFQLTYVLAGYTLHTPGHFTAVVVWHGNKYYYDGLRTSKEERLAKLRDFHLQHKNGSFAFYFIFNVDA